MLYPESTTSSPLRRAADHTAIRLGRALLGYLAVITLIITLAPFRFASAPVHGLTDTWTWSDLIMNVVMFVPIGFAFQLTRPTGVPIQWTRVLAVGAGLSATIEIAQLFESTRYTSLFDLVTNTAGAALGASVYVLASRQLDGRNAVRTLALELPLMGLVYLLVPLVWLIGLASDGGSRAWLSLPIVAFVAGILGTVYAAYVEPVRPTNRLWLLALALGWYVVALLPGAIQIPDVLLTGVALAVGVSWMRSLSTARAIARRDTRRFELPTLRLVLPLFAAYLALSSLWPLSDADGHWRITMALMPGSDAATTAVFVALEHVAAFTMVGYIIAEFYGRNVQRYRDLAGRVVLWSGGLSLLLELARGFHPAYGASVLMLVFTTSAAVLGGWLYQLQRDHVKALVARRESTGTTGIFPIATKIAGTWQVPATLTTETFVETSSISSDRDAPAPSCL